MKAYKIHYVYHNDNNNERYSLPYKSFMDAYIDATHWMQAYQCGIANIIQVDL